MGFITDTGYGADISNFTRSLTANALSNEQAHSYLEKVYSDVQQLQNTIIQPNSAQQGQSNVNVSPNIYVDLGGAYVFDNDMKQRLTDDVKNEIVSAVTQRLCNKLKILQITIMEIEAVEKWFL